MTTAPALRRFVCTGTQLLRHVLTGADGYTAREFREHTVIVDAEDAAGAARGFDIMAPEARLTYVGFDAVDGRCEGCSRPIFEGEDHIRDSEGILICRTCAPEGDE